MRRWLTDDERQLPAPERRALRKRLRRAYNLGRWPDTDGRPPWLVRAEVVAVEASHRVVLILGRAATAAVLQAAAASLAGGQVRHEFAVAALLAAATAEAIELVKEDAAGWVEDAFELLADEGEVTDGSEVATS